MLRQGGSGALSGFARVRSSILERQLRLLRHRRPLRALNFFFETSALTLEPRAGTTMRCASRSRSGSSLIRWGFGQPTPELVPRA